MIKSIGTDFLEKSRIKKIFLKHGERLVEKILSNEESGEFNSKNSLEKKVSYLSNNFASKEAISKVLGTGFSNGVYMKDIQVLRSAAGSPYASLKGVASKVAKDKGIENFHLSITDTKYYSLAFAVGEQK